MAEKVALTIDVTPAERDRIEALAQAQGYTTLSEYLRSLIEGAIEAEQTKEELHEEFREGWRAAMKGETIPASKLWDALQSDE